MNPFASQYHYADKKEPLLELLTAIDDTTMALNARYATGECTEKHWLGRKRFLFQEALAIVERLDKLNE